MNGSIIANPHLFVQAKLDLVFNDKNNKLKFPDTDRRMVGYDFQSLTFAVLNLFGHILPVNGS